LAGPVDVCVDVPKLALDRPFTYLLREDADVGIGSLVSVPFHGRTVRGWVLGPVEAPPPRVLPVRRVLSAVRFFDPAMLSLLRWVSHRYIAPLCVAIDRSHPPRVAGEENAQTVQAQGRVGSPAAPPFHPGVTTWVRPLPGEEAAECVRAVAACVEAGRQALVLVPEAEPLPETARVALEAFGDRAANFTGGDGRERYRTWLGIGAGRYDVVVGTRPAVFAPLHGLGLMWISREVHPGHREERSPYYHVREVAAARARLHGAACVLASLSPSVQTVAAVSAGSVRVRRPSRALERSRAPLVETTPPEGEDRSIRLGRLLKQVRSAALIVSRRGYGVARVCRSCGEPASCAACRGAIGMTGGAFSCRVCGAPGRCASCGGASFGVERGGTERVAEWAAGLTGSSLGVEREGETPPRPGPEALIVGTAAAVKDVGSAGLDLVAILDPDRALARPGLEAGERALATWMEAAAWARPRATGGRVLVQTRRPGHPGIQGLVRWEPEPFLRAEAAARTAAGFPPGHPVFRVEGTAALSTALEAERPESLLVTGSGEGTVCLVTVHPDRLEGFRTNVLRLVSEGVVGRVEAEPQL